MSISEKQDVTSPKNEDVSKLRESAVVSSKTLEISKKSDEGLGKKSVKVVVDEGVVKTDGDDDDGKDEKDVVKEQELEREKEGQERQGSERSVQSSVLPRIILATTGAVATLTLVTIFCVRNFNSYTSNLNQGSKIDWILLLKDSVCTWYSYRTTPTKVLAEIPECWTDLARSEVVRIQNRCPQFLNKDNIQVVYWKEDDGSVTASFPGTHSLSDWMTNLETTSFCFTDSSDGDLCRVHGGFFKHATASRELLLSDLKETPKKLLLCGHSLGAATACLVALRIKLEFPECQLRVRAFASPRVGDKDFAEMYDRLLPDTIRVAASYDVVCNMLPEVCGYSHVGNLMLLTPDNPVFGVAANHVIDRYVELILDEVRKTRKG